MPVVVEYDPCSSVLICDCCGGNDCDSDSGGDDCDDSDSGSDSDGDSDSGSDGVGDRESAGGSESDTADDVAAVDRKAPPAEARSSPPRVVVDRPWWADAVVLRLTDILLLRFPALGFSDWIVRSW